MTLVAICLVIP